MVNIQTGLSHTVDNAEVVRLIYTHLDGIDKQMNEHDVGEALYLATEVARDAAEGLKFLPADLQARLGNAVGHLAWQNLIAAGNESDLGKFIALRDAYNAIGDFNTVFAVAGASNDTRENTLKAMATNITDALQRQVVWEVIPSGDEDWQAFEAYREATGYYSRYTHKELLHTTKWQYRAQDYNFIKNIWLEANDAGIVDDLFTRKDVMDVFASRFHDIARRPYDCAADIAFLMQIAKQHAPLHDRLTGFPANDIAVSNVIAWHDAPEAADNMFLVRGPDDKALCYEEGYIVWDPGDLHTAFARAEHAIDPSKREQNFDMAEAVLTVALRAAQRGWPIRKELFGIQADMTIYANKEKPIPEHLKSIIAQLPTNYVRSPEGEKEEVAAIAPTPPKRRWWWRGPLAAKAG